MFNFFFISFMELRAYLSARTLAGIKERIFGSEYIYGRYIPIYRKGWNSLADEE
jgi:hypothetical protein